MRRQGGNDGSSSIIHTSSIALLQERFRNLERVKEMREGKELQRARSSPDTDRTGAGSSSPTSSVPALNLGLQAAPNSSEHPRWFLHTDLVRPSRPLQGPASTYNWIGADGGAQTSQPAAAAAASSYWRDVPRMQNSGYRGGDVDVDTSLHL